MLTPTMEVDAQQEEEGRQAKAGKTSDGKGKGGVKRTSEDGGGTPLGAAVKELSLADLMAAIHGSSAHLETRFNQLENTFSNRLVDLEKKTASEYREIKHIVEANTSKLDKNSEEMAQMKLDLEKLKSGEGVPSGAASSAHNPYSKGGDFTPINKRKVLFVGGWPIGVEKAQVEEKLKSMLDPFLDSVKDFWCTKKVDGKGKVEFHSNEGLWAFLKGNKGKNYEYMGNRIYYSIDKTMEESILSGKVGRAVKAVKNHLNSNGVGEEDAKKWVEAEYNLGIVYLRDVSGGTLKKVYHRAKGDTDLTIDTTIGLPFNFSPKDFLEEINANPRQ
jgi:hypothetical protein